MSLLPAHPVLRMLVVSSASSGASDNSFSSPLKNMALKNAEHIHTWHQADAHLDAGEGYKSLFSEYHQDQRELGLSSAEQTVA